jgi:hypothetical protein
MHFLQEAGAKVIQNEASQRGSGAGFGEGKWVQHRDIFKNMCGFQMQGGDSWSNGVKSWPRVTLLSKARMDLAA